MKRKIGYLFISLFVTLHAFAQNTVQGTVLDDQGQPLPGVSVKLQGSTKGAITDANGVFNLSVSDSEFQDGTVSISFIGFQTKNVKIRGKANLGNITLDDQASALGEVIVVGSSKGIIKEKLSFSVGSVDGNLLENVPSDNISNIFQGKISGVRVNTYSGQPGSEASIDIRASNSIVVGQQPLVIYDGVILEGGLADINSEDIGKVEIAKGAAAAALYGSRAANGVIEIFSKSFLTGANTGKRFLISYRTNLSSVRMIKKLPLSTRHRYKLNSDGSFELNSSGDRIQEDDTISDNPYPVLYDLQDEFFKTGFNQSHFINISTVSEDRKTQFSISYQNLKESGILELNNGYKRDNLRISGTSTVGKFVLKGNMFYSNSSLDFVGSAGGQNPVFWASAMPEPNNNPRVENTDGSPYKHDFDQYDPTNTNPLYILNNVEKGQDRDRIVSSFDLIYQINDFLFIQGAYGLDLEFNDFQEYIPKFYIGNSPDSRAIGKGYIRQTELFTKAINRRLNLVFDKKFGNWNVSSKLSYLGESYISRYNRASGYDLTVNDIRSLDNIRDSASTSLQSRYEEILSDSYFFIADVDYNDKYIFSAVYRYEGSSLFGEDNRYASYYRASVAYRLTKDVNIPGFNELKPRVSYGTAGVRPTYTMRFEAYFLRNGDTSKGTLGNNLLEPQVAKELEVGIDAQMFSSRLNFEVNYVSTITDKQILRVPLEAHIGFEYQWDNVGTVESNVFEFAINGKLVKNKDIEFDLGATFDTFDQKITKLGVSAYATGPGTQESTIYRIEEGQQFGIMYGHKFAKSLNDLPSNLNQSDYEINSEGYVVNKTTRSPYRLDQDVIGSVIPDFRMGFWGDLRYKFISLYFVLDFKKGGDVYNKTKQWLYRDGRSKDFETIREPYGYFQGLYNTNLSSEHFVEDGTFLRMRELALNFNLNSIIPNGLKKIVSSLSLGFSARNLFTISNYSGQDPEITAQGEDKNVLTSRVSNGVGSDGDTPGGDPSLFNYDSFRYPTTKSYTFYLKVKF